MIPWYETRNYFQKFYTLSLWVIDSESKHASLFRTSWLQFPVSSCTNVLCVCQCDVAYVGRVAWLGKPHNGRLSLNLRNFKSIKYARWLLQIITYQAISHFVVCAIFPRSSPFIVVLLIMDFTPTFCPEKNRELSFDYDHRNLHCFSRLVSN